jgi:DtxR family Mn-dependent transcriptional regulator
MVTEKHSLTEENYLKAIYRLSREPEEKISLTAIAEVVGVNSASALVMIKKLSDKKLISYDKSRGARLTDRGRNAALIIVRSHRLWEVFLLEKLDFPWDAVHDIAEQLEHVKYPELNDRLDKFLGYPSYDPHGDPIPKSNGNLPVVRSRPLAEIEAGRRMKVTKVSDSSPDFLRYLDKQGIGLNKFITVKEIQDFDKSVLVELKGRKEVYLSAEAAKKIYVE